MYKCYIQLRAICSSPSIWCARATGCTKWLHRYFFDPSYCIFQVLCVYSKRCLSVVVPRSPMKLQIIINQSNNDLHSSDEEKRLVEGGGWDVLFIPEDGSPAPVLLLGIVQTYPGSTDIKICWYEKKKKQNVYIYQWKLNVLNVQIRVVLWGLLSYFL